MNCCSWSLAILLSSSITVYPQTHIISVYIIGGNMTLRDNLLAFEVTALCVTQASSVWYACVWFVHYSVQCISRESFIVQRGVSGLPAGNLSFKTS